MKHFLIILSLCLFAACSDVTDGRVTLPPPPEPGENISNGPASGQIAGSFWEIKSGRAEAGFINGDEAFIVEIWDEVPTDICDPFTVAERGVRFTIPREPKVYEIGPQRPLNFFQGVNVSVVRDKGEILVEEIILEDGDHFLVGGVNAVYDAANIVNGRFSVLICE